MNTLNHVLAATDIGFLLNQGRVIANHLAEKIHIDELKVKLLITYLDNVAPLFYLLWFLSKQVEG